MNIESMTKKELIDYAETLGIDIKSRDSVEEIRNKIYAANGEAPDTTSEKLEGEIAKTGKDPEEELTVIFNVGEDGDTTNVYFGINGKQMSLPRNKEVKVKRKYLDMLTNECVGYKVVQEVNPQTGLIETKRVKKPVYTFQIVS